MPAGPVMFFTGSVLRGGGANKSDSPRLGTILHYCAGRPRLQELLGDHVHPPFVGSVDGRHPRKLLEG